MQSTLVLSGGGAKGDFEVGVLQYMYENGYVANAICSTSVGSVNGVQLAHGHDGATQKAAFDTLKSIWENQLTSNSDMYSEAPWLANVSPRTRAAVVDLFSGKVDLSRPLSDFVLFPPYLIGQVIAAGIDLTEALDGMKTAKSVFTLDPTAKKVNQNLNAATVAHSGVELRLVAVSLDSGRIRYITQNGLVTETDNTPVPSPGLTSCTAERAAYNAAVQALAGAGSRMQKARTVEDRREAMAEVRQAGAQVEKARQKLRQCEAAAPGGPNPLVVSVADGVIASASIPCVFPPVQLGAESYVDGGVRWVLPLKAALAFNFDLIVAVNASPPGVWPAAVYFANANMLDIAERTVMDILLWEVQERHLEAVKLEALQQKKRVWVVTPRVNVHDTLTIDPGLIDINIGYGYMRAADVLSGDVKSGFPFAPHPFSLPQPVNVPGGHPAPPAPGVGGTWVDEAPNQPAADLADAITMCRRRCWDLEHGAFGVDAGEGPFSKSPLVGIPQETAYDEVRLLKTFIGILIDARRSVKGALPPDANDWPDKWGRHQWSTVDPRVGNTPWDKFDNGIATRTAAVRQTALYVRLSSSQDVYLLDPSKHKVSTAALAKLSPSVSVIPDEVSSILDALPAGNDIV
jgi:predicted acylesterase/phospholipase RssA